MVACRFSRRRFVDPQAASRVSTECLFATGLVAEHEYHELMVDQVLLTQAKQLSPADRLELIGELWQTLEHDTLPVTNVEKVLLDERIADLSAHPGSGRPWGDVEAELLSRLR